MDVCFVQYKTERVLSSAAEVQPGNAVSTMSTDKAAADQLLADLPAASAKLSEVATVLLEGGAAEAANTRIVETTRIIGLNMAATLPDAAAAATKEL